MGQNHSQGPACQITIDNGRSLHTRALPGPPGAPTVVFEAGAATMSSSWALVQPAVGEFARAVVYDRSGMGRSEPDPVSRTLRRMADDLGALLDTLGAGPFVLVGHSAGGPIVRLAAADRPDRIAGLVLVDPADEASDVLFSRAFRFAEQATLRVNLALAHTKLLRHLYRPMLRALPGDARRDMARDGFTVDLVHTHAKQIKTFLDELRAFRDHPPTLGDIPVTVISGGRTGAGMNARTRADATASHAQRAARSPMGRHVVATNSGHIVPITDPHLIVAETQRLAQPARHGSGNEPAPTSTGVAFRPGRTDTR